MKIMFVFALCFMLVSCSSNDNEGAIKPVITLNGDQTISLQVGEEYVELGATALEGEIELDVVIIGIVDNMEIGEYQVKYNAGSSHLNLADEVIRTVNVIDTTPPTIAFSEIDDFTHEQGTPFSYEQIVRTDNYDKYEDIEVVMTGTIDVNTLGTYDLSFHAIDSHGNQSITISKTVTVIEQEDLDYYQRFMKEHTSMYDPDSFYASYLFAAIEEVYRGVVLNNGVYEPVYYFFLHNQYEGDRVLRKIEFVCSDADNFVYEIDDSKLDWVFQMPVECVNNSLLTIITYAHPEFVSASRVWEARFSFGGESNLEVDHILSLDLKDGNLK